MDPHGAQQPLARIASVDPRLVWPNEARNFTPWLREHIDQLGEALGLDLEIREAEVPVGEFAVDLLGEDLTNGRRLIVENQLEATDHNHLGQLLTYAGGLDAATIVWVSTAVRDEHRQALDWLNRHTDEAVSFFGVAVEVIRIADSPAAPVFKLAAAPNDWGRAAKRAADQAEPTGVQAQRKRFFETMLAEVKRLRPGLTNTRSILLQNWVNLSAGRTGFLWGWVFPSDKTLRIELYIDTPSAADNKGLLRALQARAPEFEAAVGEPLTWEPLENRRAARVSTSRPLPPAFDEDADLLEWGVATFLRFYDAFAMPIKTLKPLAEAQG